ncbi:MAG: methyltransferase domain-containing protein [Candidatus Sumerlaeia bacterium]|nr:methyltransferase domain-containing protein [Candidatus Sumerlaeia bacterium]
MTPESLVQQGGFHLAQGRIEQAVEVLVRALESCPDLLDDIGDIFANTSLRVAAIANLNQRMQSAAAPAAPELALAARLLRDAGRASDAVHHARRAVEASPDCASWRFELGEAYLGAGDRSNAAAAYRECLRIQSRHLLAQSRLALCRSRRWRVLAHWIYRFRLVRRMLRRVIRSGGRMHLLEMQGDSAGAHQMRWAQACEQGSALSIFPLPPRAVLSPELQNMGREDNPTFWRWFTSLNIADNIRTVLDVGCGTGFSTERFLRRGYDVTGVTSNPHEKRETAARGIHVLDADFHFLPLADASYDLVFSSHSLEHSISPVFALWEWKRVLRPGGYLYIVLPFPVEIDSRTSEKHYDPETDTMVFTRTDEQVPLLEDVRADHSAFGMWGHIYVMNRRQLERIFRRVGFEIVAEAAEDPITNEVIAVEQAEARRPRGAERPYNGLFLLRKPARTPASETALPQSARNNYGN